MYTSLKRTRFSATEGVRLQEVRLYSNDNDNDDDDELGEAVRAEKEREEIHVVYEEVEMG